MTKATSLSHVTMSQVDSDGAVAPQSSQVLGFVFFSDVANDADMNRDTAIRFSEERGTHWKARGKSRNTRRRDI